MKRILTFLLASVCLLILTSCMSDEEQQKAKQNEQLAVPIVQNYLNEHFGGGILGDAACITETKSDPLFPVVNQYATGYVRVSVWADWRNFSVIANVNTSACYDNYNRDSIIRSMRERAASSLLVDSPDYIEVHYRLKGLQSMYFDGFAERNDIDADAVLESGRYDISVICRYIASEMDFSQIDASGFFPKQNSAPVRLALVNFRDRGRYSSNDMTSIFEKYDGDDFYRCSDILTAQTDPDADKPDILQDYVHASLKAINGMELAWDAGRFDLQAAPTESGITIACTALQDSSVGSVPDDADGDTNETADHERSKIYCFFDKSRLEETVKVNGADDLHTHPYTWKLRSGTQNGDYICKELSPDSRHTTYTLEFSWK